MSDQTPLYDLEIYITGMTYPYRVSHTGSENAREIIESTYAAWGVPIPDSLRNTEASTFADRLAETGRYVHAEGKAETTVKPAGQQP